MAGSLAEGEPCVLVSSCLFVYLPVFVIGTSSELPLCSWSAQPAGSDPDLVSCVSRLHTFLGWQELRAGSPV